MCAYTCVCVCVCVCALCAVRVCARVRGIYVCEYESVCVSVSGCVCVSVVGDKAKKCSMRAPVVGLFMSSSTCCTPDSHSNLLSLPETLRRDPLCCVSSWASAPKKPGV